MEQHSALPHLDLEQMEVLVHQQVVHHHLGQVQHLEPQISKAVKVYRCLHQEML